MNVTRFPLLLLLSFATACYASSPSSPFGDAGNPYEGSGDDSGTGNPGTGGQGGQDASGNPTNGGGQDAGGNPGTGGGQDAGSPGTGGKDAGQPVQDSGNPTPPVDASEPVDASPPPADASSGGPTATWTYLYPTYFEGATTATTPGHCSPSCHNHNSDGSNTATSSTLVQKAYKDNLLTIQGSNGTMPEDNNWTDATALSLVNAWAAAGYPQ